MRSARTEQAGAIVKEEKIGQSIDATTKEKLEYSNDTLRDLEAEIGNIKNAPDSYGLAVRVEMIFSLSLLQHLLRNQHDDLDEKARQLLTFLKARWDGLCNTAAWDVYSRRSKINIACDSTVKCFLKFYPDNFVLRQIAKYNADCERLEADILNGEAEHAAALGEEKIYKFIYRNMFAKQPIHHAWSLLPKVMRDAGSDKDTWRILLSNVIPEVNNRLTLIRMLAKQVEREDWQYFFSRLTNHGQLFSLMLGLDITQLLKVHESLPLDRRTDANFEAALYAAADTLLRECNDGWGYFQLGGSVGSKFKSKIQADHGCENQIEVLALAYALLETYHRVRVRMGGHTSDWGKLASRVATISDKDVKVAGCDVLMAFCLQAEQFSKAELENYITAKKREGSLTIEKEKEFRKAIEEGVLKMLLDVLCAINEKVRAMPAPVLK